MTRSASGEEYPVTFRTEAGTPDHLGGHLNKTHVDVGSLKWLVDNYDVATMVDVGCGPGGMRFEAEKLGVTWYGVDGDESVWVPGSRIHTHDFTLGSFKSAEPKYDLGWSVEFLEHVEERYVPSYMDLFSRCRVVAATAAPPGYPGHHHVNCRSTDYWAGVFAAHGFVLDAAATATLRSVSTMVKPFMQRTGMLFRRYDYCD